MPDPKSGVWPGPAANEDKLLARVRESSTLRQVGLYSVHPDMASNKWQASGSEYNGSTVWELDAQSGLGENGDRTDHIRVGTVLGWANDGEFTALLRRLSLSQLVPPTNLLTCFNLE